MIPAIYAKRSMRILVTTLRCLLVVATSASADCTWVLWGRADDVWTPRDTYPTEAKCREGRLRLTDDARK